MLLYPLLFSSYDSSLIDTSIYFSKDKQLI